MKTLTLRSDTPLANNAWIQAIAVVGSILRTCVMCALVTPLINWWFTLGNIFSPRSSAVQSMVEFITGVQFTMYIVTQLSIWVFLSMGLLRARFVSAPTRPPTLFTCMLRLGRYVLKSTIVGCLVVVLATYVVGISSIGLLTRGKLHMYMSVAVATVMSAIFEVAQKETYQRETVKGVAAGHINTTAFPLRVVACLRRLRVFHFAIALSSAFVHLATVLSPELAVDKLLIFALTSVSCKMLFQTLGKHHLQRQKTLNPVTVYLVLMAPTVLVETQLRVALLRFQLLRARDTTTQNYLQIYVFGTLGIIELVVRIAKLSWLRYSIRQSTPTHSHPVSASIRRVRVLPEAASVNIESWRQRKLFLFGVSSLADMYAEYVAIISATSVFGFYRNHPKYALLPNGTTATSVTDLGRSMAIQAVTELIVDYICCVAEVAMEVPLRPPLEMRSIVVHILVQYSVSNVCYCACAYVRDVDGAA